jgi:aryl-alcohol dehydrogenase-like predicted oxidoreductase
VERRILGRTKLEVSIVGFGAANIGFLGANQAVDETLLNTVLDAGINVIDTAECYGDSEQRIGRCIAHRRQEFHLFTKCGHANGLDYDDWDPRLLELTINRSLKRLGTDYVDLLQLHSCNEATLRRGDVIAVLERARQAGKTRFIGYSGDSKAAVFAIRTGSFDTLQISLNIADQEAVSSTIQHAREQGAGIIAKRSVANAAWRLASPPEDVFVRPYWERLRLLDYDFLRSDPRTAVRTALSFTLTVPGIHTALVGTVNAEHLKENLLGIGALPPATYEQIRKRWHAIAPPEWTAADETRPVSLRYRIKEGLRRLRRSLKRTRGN